MQSQIGQECLGEIGQAMADVVTGGSPGSFLLELPSRARLTVDIYLPRGFEPYRSKPHELARRLSELSGDETT